MQTTADAATAAPADSSAPRACNSSGCKVNKYVEATKRKCPQFVTSPHIMQKPLVVSGNTSIFQVGGNMAKLGDIPALSAATGGNGNGQPIYRIKPGTHSHIVNYVFVDGPSDSVEKAKFEDQESMRIMLESHRTSATSKLLKLTSMHRGVATETAAPVTEAHADALILAAGSSVNGLTTPQHLASVPAVAVTQTTSATTTATSAPGLISDREKTLEQLRAEIESLKSQIARHGGT